MLDDTYCLLDTDHVGIFERALEKYGTGIVLDIGCGPRDPSGNKMRLIRGRYIGIDISSMIAGEFVKYSMPTNAHFVQADIRRLPFASGSVDLALMLGVYGDCRSISELNAIAASHPDGSVREIRTYLEKGQSRLLAETARVLKPRGHLIVSNSVDRQPVIPTVHAFEKRFMIERLHEGKERYLLECSVRS